MDNNLTDRTTGYNSSPCAHEKVLRLAEASRQKLDAFPVEALLAMLASGRTQTEISKAAGVPQSAISVWLSNQNGELADQIALARRLGGEACLDRGLEELEKARGGDTSAVALARAFDGHWARRAGLFNRSLHDKGEIVQQTPTPPNPPSFTIHIISAAPQPQTLTIDHAADDPI